MVHLTEAYNLYLMEDIEHFVCPGPLFYLPYFFFFVVKLCLALRYLHKEKRIVHRDLTPNNIMLGDKDKVTISKF